MHPRSGPFRRNAIRLGRWAHLWPLHNSGICGRKQRPRSGAKPRSLLCSKTGLRRASTIAPNPARSPEVFDLGQIATRLPDIVFQAPGARLRKPARRRRSVAPLTENRELFEADRKALGAYLKQLDQAVKYNTQSLDANARDAMTDAVPLADAVRPSQHTTVTR